MYECFATQEEPGHAQQQAQSTARAAAGEENGQRGSQTSQQRGAHQTVQRVVRRAPQCGERVESGGQGVQFQTKQLALGMNFQE
jgi:hypothetical protein